MTTDPQNCHTSNSKMRRCILSLTLVACFALSLSFTPSTATANPISNNNQPSNSAAQVLVKSHHHQKAHNNGGLLNRLSSSWTSLTTPLQGLHAISGSPGPAPKSNSGPNVKRFHKRAIDIKKPTTAAARAGTLGGKTRGAQKKKVGKSTARVNTYSAYEAIVNSDSQMPVFLNQHHPMTTSKGSGNGKGKSKPTSPSAPVAAGGEKKRKAGAVTPIDILRQTGTKKPTAASPITPFAEEEAKDGERKKKEKAEMEGTSPARKTEAETEGMTPAKEPFHPNKTNNNTKKLSLASRAVVAAAVEDGTSTVKALFDTVFSQEEQPSRRTTVESATGTAVEMKGEDSEDIKGIRETINAAAHAAVTAAATAAVASNSHHDTAPNSHHLEGRDTAGILKQALEDIAHKIEEAATAAIALEIPSLIGHTLVSHSSAASREREPALEGEKLAPVFENHQDTMIDDEGAIDLPAIANNNNHHDTISASKTDEEPSFTVTKQKPSSIFINDNEYVSHPSSSSNEYSDTITSDEWHLIDSDDDGDDYMSQYIHRQPDSFPGSESVLFTGTVLQRTLASSFLLLSGFAMLIGLISYKMYARRRNTSPWAFLHYMTCGVFGSLFYDSAYLSNSTLNSYTTTSQSSTMKNGFGSGPTSTTTTSSSWLRRGSLTRPAGHNHNIMSTPAEKEPLLPEPVVASSTSTSSSSSSTASSLFKNGDPSRTELRRTSTAQHHQMQIELALQQQQQQRREEEHQADMDYLQWSFMRRTSI
ncbi:hypothetical protein EC957_008215 [Mortierella hygrophila]|uniref:Uncharacterized protein n=1 Tax=Mortierella hygrophila TaxID=979708 RepID=A0A9P6FD13_9FUNG|nr:hypothetical protein EC957_008215 [Mortierella hygrophila]